MEGIKLKEKKVQSSIKNLKQLTTEVTQACNLRCKYCVYGDFYPFQRKHSSKRIEPFVIEEGINYVYELINARNYKEFQIGFYGGEPLLYFDLIKDIVSYVQKKFKGWKISFYLTTNGTLITKGMVEFFIKNRFNLAISLDGPKENHDVKRITPSGEGSFEKVYESLRLIKEIDEKYFFSKVSFSCVFSLDLSFKHLYDFFIKDDLVNKNTILLGFVNMNKTTYYFYFPKKK